MAPSVASARVHDAVSARLGQNEQRYTPQRRAVIDALSWLGRPGTIGEILEAVPGLPLSTAYRNLTVLSDAGAVRRVSGSDEFGRFELGEELIEHHHHVVCESCGLVVDATASPGLERALDETSRAIARENGFEIKEHRLELVGRCTACRT